MKLKRNSIAIATLTGVAVLLIMGVIPKAAAGTEATRTGIEAAGNRAPGTGSDDASESAKGNSEYWEIVGELSEACTCAVPCTCNFSDGPSPRHYCYALFSLDIAKGHYGALALDGLHLAGAHGKNGEVWYLDDRATPEQSRALRAIAAHIRTRKNSYFETAHIVQEVGQKGNRVEIGDKGGFEAEYILGGDKKTPVVVENNTTWNIAKSIKGKTKRLRYKDQHGNKFDMSATNSNQGKFDWTDQTSFYF